MMTDIPKASMIENCLFTFNLCDMSYIIFIINVYKIILHKWSKDSKGLYSGKKTRVELYWNQGSDIMVNEVRLNYEN